MSKLDESFPVTPQKRWIDSITPGFIITIATILVGFGIAYGTIQLNLNSIQLQQTKAEVEREKIRTEYLRTDIYLVKHQALEDQLRDIASQIREMRNDLRRSNRVRSDN